MTTSAPTLLPAPHAALGARVADGGVSFAVFSQRARAVELCLFDDTGTRETARLPLVPGEDAVFHGHVPGLAAGQRYGYRAHGSWKPESGYRFNPHKLLLDPYARAVAGEFQWRPEHFGHVHGHPEGLRVQDVRDNGPWALKSVVCAPDVPAVRSPATPRRPLGESVLYELHVKGFTRALPGVPDALRGTFAGLAHPASVAHLQRLGVTAVSLLPVQQALDEEALARRGLHNYWGYNTLAFFAPDPRLAADRTPEGAVAEFKAMVTTLQAADIEVILDVVFNHTAEGDEHGPTLCWRGLDNPSWYRLMQDDRSRYENASGCGNTLRVIHPRATQFVLDALRYWVEVMGVDGFRFDLAPALGRTRHGFDPSAPFWVALRQDPTLARVHLIAEPWDAAHDGYQLGRLPGRFAEWNDRFRDTVRGYWLGEASSAPPVDRSAFARRFTASSDLFHHAHRAPTASINYVAAHDGRTLADVVSYRERHNHANGEHNRDGHAHEVCGNFGVEGPSDDATVNDARRRVRRAMLATVLLAQGTPMLCAGDEFGNSQAGNNNAYCQDNATGWLDWQRAGHEDDTAFVARLVALRRTDPLLRHARWFAPAPTPGEPAIHWCTPDGTAMTVDDWHAPDAHAFACALADDADAPPRWLLAFNPSAHDLPFTLPPGPWHVAIDSSATLPDDAAPPADGVLVIPARALCLLRRGAPLVQETAR